MSCSDGLIHCMCMRGICHTNARVRVLMRSSNGGSALPRVNGVALTLDVSAGTNALQHARGENTYSATDWAWYAAAGVVLDSSIVLSSVDNDGGCVDRLEITSSA